MINTSPDKQSKRYKPIQSRYIEQVRPDESLSSNTDIDQNDQQIRQSSHKTLPKKGSIRIRNLDIDSDIIKEDISEENKSDQESDVGYTQNRNIQVAFTPNNEEEAQNPFKTPGHQYSDSLWKVNIVGNHHFDLQQNGTPKESKDHDSLKAEQCQQFVFSIERVTNADPIRGHCLLEFQCVLKTCSFACLQFYERNETIVIDFSSEDQFLSSPKIGSK